MNQPETDPRGARRPPGGAQTRRPGSAYWLISRTAGGRIGVLTLDQDGEETLPVFGHEEEAEMFLGLGGAGDGWRATEIRAGGLISVLYGPCASAKRVALDPLPEMVAEATVGLVSLPRERFIERILARSGRPSPPASRPRGLSRRARGAAYGRGALDR